MLKFLLKTLREKIRNNMYDYYSVINLQGLRSNIYIYALILSLKKIPVGKTRDKAYACIEHCLIKNFE